MLRCGFLHGHCVSSNWVYCLEKCLYAYRPKNVLSNSVLVVGGMVTKPVRLAISVTITVRFVGFRRICVLLCSGVGSQGDCVSRVLV